MRVLGHVSTTIESPSRGWRLTSRRIWDSIQVCPDFRSSSVAAESKDAWPAAAFWKIRQ